MKKILNILITGVIGVGKTTTLNLFPSDWVLELDDEFNEILQKTIILPDFEEVDKCLIREIDLEEILNKYIMYKEIINSSDIVLIFTNSTSPILRNTKDLLGKMREKLPNTTFYIVANFQDKNNFSLDKVKNTLKYKTFAFTAVLEDSKQKFIEIIRDISSHMFPKQPISEIVLEEDINAKIWSIIGDAQTHEKKGDFFDAAKCFSNVIKEIEKSPIRNQTDSEIVYYLCKSWECIALSQEEKKTKFLSEAKNYFNLVKDRINSVENKLYISANSLFCDILTHTMEFDRSNEMDREKKFIPEIKKILEEIISIFQEGSFQAEESWALGILTTLENMSF